MSLSAVFHLFTQKNFYVQTKITTFAFPNALLTRHAMKKVV